MCSKLMIWVNLFQEMSAKLAQCECETSIWNGFEMWQSIYYISEDKKKIKEYVCSDFC